DESLESGRRRDTDVASRETAPDVPLVFALRSFGPARALSRLARHVAAKLAHRNEVDLVEAPCPLDGKVDGRERATARILVVRKGDDELASGKPLLRSAPVGAPDPEPAAYASVEDEEEEQNVNQSLTGPLL